MTALARRRLRSAAAVVQHLDVERLGAVANPVQLSVIVVLASVAGVLAAVGPARRTAKLDMLDAIAST